MSLFAELSRRAVRLSPRIGVPLGRLHGLANRLSGGRLGNTFITGGAPVLFLITTGRRSGKRRENPLIYARDGERYVIAGSNAGAGPQPAWIHNLRADPRAEVRVEGQTVPVAAEVAEGQERVRLWAELKALYDGYESYQGQTEREIPVVVLTPDTP